MALSPDISLADIDALSPIDESLMYAIRTNLINLDGQINGSGSALAPVLQFKLNGQLDYLQGGRVKRFDGCFISNQQTLSSCQIFLEQQGTSGTCEVDLRTIDTPKIPIVSVMAQFQAATQSLARAGSALSTQSITRVTAQISTQSITQFKPTLNIVSIVFIGGNTWQVNLSGAPDADWVVGDYITISGATAAGNNGNFQILRLNDYGSSSVTITNAFGVAQDTAVGTLTLRAYSYNFTNPVSSQFVAGESASFASHTTAGNNGTLPIYAVNLNGNNIVVKNLNGATQSGVAGAVNVQRFSYNLAAAASAADFVVSDTILASSHTTAANNGTFTITAVNSGGNNVQVYIAAGTTQGTATGNVQSNQQVIALAVSPVGNVSVGDEVYLSSHTNAANNGSFIVRQVNRGGANNVTVHNSSQVVQAGVAGLVTHSTKIVRFASDQSSLVPVGAFIEIEGASSSLVNCYNSYDLGFQVTQVNRGGGANYNAVIKISGDVANQASQAGWVSVVSKSIFTVTPKIVVSPIAARTLGAQDAQKQTVEAVFLIPTLAAGTRLGAYVVRAPSGAVNLSVQVR